MKKIKSYLLHCLTTGLAICLLTGFMHCKVSAASDNSTRAQQILKTMTWKEKIAQMFPFLQRMRKKFKRSTNSEATYFLKMISKAAHQKRREHRLKRYKKHQKSKC